MYFTLQYIRLRACLKNALRKMCVTICGRFCSDEGVVVDYDNRIRTKYTAIYISCFAKSIFQTRSKKELYFRNFKCVSISELHLNHEI